jgi:hypothetical protein
LDFPLAILSVDVQKVFFATLLLQKTEQRLNMCHSKLLHSGSKKEPSMLTRPAAEAD